MKISQNCGRDTDGVVHYCPPRKTGAHRSSHKQQLTIEITFGTPPPGPHTPSRPPPNMEPAHGPHHHARGQANRERAMGPGIPPGGKTQKSAGEPALCLFGVLPPPPPRHMVDRLTPASPGTRGTQRPQSPACSHRSHPKHIRTRHTRTHNAPSKLCQAQSMQWGIACRRIKATRLICRLKFRGYPMQSITSPHRVIVTTVDLKHGTGTWAALAGPGGGDHECPKGPGIPAGGRTPQPAGEPSLCLFGVPGASRPAGRLTPTSPRPAAPVAHKCLARWQPNHLKHIRPGTRARTML